MSKDINCPYCQEELDICHDDGFGYEEGVKHEMECDKCGKSFIFQTQISFDYYPEKSDCLNGAPHDYKASRSYPKEYSKMECTMCDKTRKPTEEEFKAIL